MAVTEKSDLNAFANAAETTFPLDRNYLARITSAYSKATEILSTASDAEMWDYLSEYDYDQLMDLAFRVGKRLDAGRKVRGLAEEQFEPGTIARIDVHEPGADERFREGSLLYIREFWSAGMSGSDEYQVDSYDGEMVEFAIPANYLSRASEAQIQSADTELSEQGLRRIGAEVMSIAKANKAAKG